MNTEDFTREIDHVYSCLTDLTLTKGKEYRAGDDDQLANFKRLGASLKMPMEKILLVYFTKHMDSILNYVHKCTERVEPIHYEASEPIKGRIDDAILYLVLLRAMVTEREGSPARGEGGEP